MSAQNRKTLEQTVFNLRFDMDCIGDEAAMYEELSNMSDTDLERVLNEMLKEI